MSIAVIVDTFPRWSERFIARELNELKRRGAKMTIYCLRAGDTDCDIDPEFSELLKDRVVLPACFIPSAARDLGMDEAALRRRALVEAELGVLAFRQIGCANSLVKLLRDQKPDVVYAHFASLPSTLGWLAAEALNLPLVISAHARDVFVEAQLLLEKIRYSRRIFTCNQKALGVLLDAQVKTPVEKKITLMSHGLPLEFFEFKKRVLTEATGQVKLLAAGRFVHKKGFHDLIEAVARVDDPRVSLTLLGDGPEHKALLRQVSKAGLGERVYFAGSVQQNTMRKFFEESDALLVPSINAEDGDSEGVPNIALEAFALGLPVIGTLAGSMAEILSAETGAVVAERDPIGLAQAISVVAAEPEIPLSKTSAARAMIEARYDIRVNIEALLKALGL